MEVKPKLPLVAIIGRPNVGKSTIFNRFVGRRLAIVDEMEGVTRDRIYGESEWEGNRYRVVDCGGIARESEDPLHEIVSENALRALNEADLVLFVTDAKAGVTDADDLVKREIWKSGKPAILVVNKVDSKKYEAELYQFYALGFTEVAYVSAASGRFFQRLLDMINDKLGFEPESEKNLSAAEKKLLKERRREEYEKALAGEGEFDGEAVEYEDFPGGDAGIGGVKEASDSEVSIADYIAASQDAGEDSEEYDESDGGGLDDFDLPDGGEFEITETIRIAILGRQNVGKSSLANAFIKDNAVIVSELPGTTRDPIEIGFEHDGTRFTVLDTAGLKKLSRVKESVDFYSMLRTSNRLPDTDVSILLIDAIDGIYEMDKLVAKKIADAGKAVVVAVNKWDLVEDGDEERKKYLKYVRRLFNKLSWANVVFISALKNRGVDELLGAVKNAWRQYHKRVADDVLKEVLFEEISLKPPPVIKNNPLKFYNVRQVAIRPPTIKIWISLKKALHFSYKGFIENVIRQHFGYDGTIVNIIYEEQKKKTK